jgi:ketosteroid isomerase-like protein
VRIATQALFVEDIEERCAMNSEANRRAAIAAWQTFRTRDPGQIAAVFTEDAEWLAPANNATAVALKGPWHIISRDQIARVFATEVHKLFVADVAAEFRGFYADGNIVVIEQRLRATLANGNAYDNDYCFVLELENGLIRRVREYMDTAKGNRMVFGAS